MLSSSAHSRSWTAVFLFAAVICSLLTSTFAVKHENFKTCDQSGFCKRNRAYADKAASTSISSPYKLDAKSITFKNGQLSGTITKSVHLSGDAWTTVYLPLTVTFLESGVARVTLDEEKRQKRDIVMRHDSKARKERYNEAADWALVGGLDVSKGAALGKDTEAGTTKVHYGPESKFEAIVKHAPFGVEFKRDGETHVRFNDRGLLNVEHWRQKIEKEPPKEGEEQEEDKKDEGDDESTWWDESFGGNRDSKPRGPESVGMDISFPGYDHVFGIPEHASSLSLKETRCDPTPYKVVGLANGCASGGDGKYSDPYRMYNSDVFEYEMDSPMTLYGSIPFMQAHKKDSTVGVFWLNGAETWVDITKSKSAVNQMSLGVAGTTTAQTHWFSESGLLDVFVFLGPSPKDVVQKYGELTGYTQLPQHFSIAYHQCRWNYVTDQDVMDVDRKFDKHRIPYDIIWLDIEYTDEKKYFTWDPHNFPNPDVMHQHLDKRDRKLVAIIDPHIKNVGDYPVVDEMKSKDLAVHNKDDNIYEGWCWPGSSHWLDAFNPKGREWWNKLFTYTNKYWFTAPNTFIWNDMNEPSVFNGPETTMPKDNLHHGGWEHRDVHNINGMTFVNATFHALEARDTKHPKDMSRPFVLTRSFFSGSQRLGAMWTGDNQAAWPHLAASLPMVLNNGISGFPFAGADVGGFFGNPSKELLTRWYQAGAFYPFFRGHAHIDTRRREPYVAGSPYTEIMTQAIRLRYSLLPAWYTAFHTASVTGEPVVRPNYYVHPSDEAGFAVEDQMYLANTGLLVKPITEEGADKTDVYLADDEAYFDYFEYTVYKGRGKHTVPAPLEKLPLLMRSGHIIPRRDRPRRSSGLMEHDPLTLVVVLGANGEADAEGEIYLDDGKTYDYRSGAYIWRRLLYSHSTSSLTSVDFENPVPTKGAKTDAYRKSMDKVRVEKVVIVNPPKSWKGKGSVAVSEEGMKESARKKSVEMRFMEGGKGKADWAVVRDPKIAIGKGWRIDFS